LIFRRVLPAGVSLEVAGASDPQFDPSDWWKSRQGRKTFFLESVSYLEALWELRNLPPESGSAEMERLGQTRTY